MSSAPRRQFVSLLRPALTLLALAVMALPAAAQNEEPLEAMAEYTVGVEDLLEIRVWGETELGATVRVRPDGKITVPLVNDLYVKGRTTEEIRADISAKLESFVRNPNVTVILNELNSFKIYVLGEVQAQGVFALQRPTTILQAVAITGGLTVYSKKSITLIRRAGGEEVRLVLDYKRILKGEDPNIFVEPGDTLIVELDSV